MTKKMFYFCPFFYNCSFPMKEAKGRITNYQGNLISKLEWVGFETLHGGTKVKLFGNALSDNLFLCVGVVLKRTVGFNSTF